MKGSRQFVDVMDHPIRLNEIAKDVEGAVREIVYWVKTLEAQPVQLTHDASLPKGMHAFNGKTHTVFIPEAEVRVDGKRHIGVKGISAPLPLGAGNHRRDMVAKIILAMARGVGLIAYGLQGSSDAVDGFWRTVDVEISLHAQPCILYKVRALGKAFNHQMVDVSGVQRCG